jgi:hypothetical protein
MELCDTEQCISHDSSHCRFRFFVHLPVLWASEVNMVRNELLLVSRRKWRENLRVLLGNTKIVMA